MAAGAPLLVIFRACFGWFALLLLSPSIHPGDMQRFEGGRQEEGCQKHKYNVEFTLEQ